MRCADQHLLPCLETVTSVVCSSVRVLQLAEQHCGILHLFHRHTAALLCVLSTVTMEIVQNLDSDV